MDPFVFSDFSRILPSVRSALLDASVRCLCFSVHRLPRTRAPSVSQLCSGAYLPVVFIYVCRIYAENLTLAVSTLHTHCAAFFPPYIYFFIPPFPHFQFPLALKPFLFLQKCSVRTLLFALFCPRPFPAPFFLIPLSAHFSSYSFSSLIPSLRPSFPLFSFRFLISVFFCRFFSDEHRLRIFLLILFHVEHFLRNRFFLL